MRIALAESLTDALKCVSQIAKRYDIAIVVPMDWHSLDGLVNTAFVISSEGEVLGHQTKNQLDPSEYTMWLPGTERQIFEVNGVKFGISICHEGFRYPESATSIIDLEGKCIAYQDYGKTGVLIKDIDIELATGILAKRFKNELYEKQSSTKL